MIKKILIIIAFTYTQSYVINSDINKVIEKNIDSNCNYIAYNTTNNYELFVCTNKNNCYYNENLINKNTSDLKDIIEYNKIRLNCIRNKQEDIINNMLITYMAIFVLILLIQI